MEIEVDEFHALQEQICNLQDCCSDWEKHALDYKAENIALSGELERTRKALDVAKEALKYARQRGLDNTATLFAVGSKADKALEQITALEQKDK